MSLSAFPTLLKKLKNKDYREAYVSSNVQHSIARQIRSLREQRKWSQKTMGEKANKPQNVISRLENPSAGQVSVQSLLELASAFDVGLAVRFVKFEECISLNASVSSKSFEISDFNTELDHSLAEDSINRLLESMQEHTKFQSNIHGEEDFLFSASRANRLNTGAESKNMYSGQKTIAKTILKTSNPEETLTLQ